MVRADRTEIDGNPKRGKFIAFSNPKNRLKMPGQLK